MHWMSQNRDDNSPKIELCMQQDPNKIPEGFFFFFRNWQADSKIYKKMQRLWKSQNSFEIEEQS